MAVVIHSFDVFKLLVLSFDYGLSVLSFLGVRFFCYFTLYYITIFFQRNKLFNHDLHVLTLHHVCGEWDQLCFPTPATWSNLIECVNHCCYYPMKTVGFFFENVFHSVLIVYECLYKKLECTIFFFGNQTCSDNQRSCYLLDLLFRNRIKSSTIKFIKTNGSFGISLSIVGSVHITYVFDINRRKLLTEIST